MERFLKNYVQMIAETSEVELTKTQLQNIVNSIQEDDEIWDILDSHIRREIESEVE